MAANVPHGARQRAETGWGRGALVEACGVDAAADRGEVDGLRGQLGPGFPAVEGRFDIGVRNVGSADRHDVAVVGAVGVGHHGDELAGAVECFG
jgi:hypothetical protein